MSYPQLDDAAKKRLDSIIRDNMGLVVSLARSFNPKDDDQLSEFIQLGCIGVWKAVVNHDPSKSKLSTYMGNHIVWEISRYLDKKKRKGCATTELLNHYGGEQDSPFLWEYLPPTLTNEEREVINLKLSGHTFVEIDQKLGYSKYRSNSIYKKAKQKIIDANK